MMKFTTNHPKQQCSPPVLAYINVGCHDNKKTALDHMAELAKKQEATHWFKHKPNPTGMPNMGNKKLGQFFIQKKK